MTSQLKRITCISILVLLILTGCTRHKEITIRDVWGRPGITGGNSAVYFQIINSTETDDVLRSAEFNQAEKTEIHMSSLDENSVMMIKPQESVEVKSGSEVDFKPGGLHVMLINLNRDLNAGDKIKINLNFEKTGTITITAVIQKP